MNTYTRVNPKSIYDMCTCFIFLQLYLKGEVFYVVLARGIAPFIIIIITEAIWGMVF